MAESVIRTPWCSSYFSFRPRSTEMVSSTVGSLTNTAWKRRARAASFSTYLRYSSSVVAPTQCSSPRASAGLSRLEASIAPSALPAPTRVCISSMNRMISPLAPVTSFSTDFRRSSNSPRNLAPAISEPMSSAISFLSRKDFGHIAIDDAQRQAFGDRGLAHAGLADQHRIVLGAAAEHLDGAADFLVAPDHGIELAGPGQFGQVAGIFLQRVIGILGRGAVGGAALAQFGDRRVQPLGGDAGIFQDARGSRCRWPAPAPAADIRR